MKIFVLLFLLFAALLVAGCAVYTLDGQDVPLPWPDLSGRGINPFS
jgi:hypothetical protein